MKRIYVAGNYSRNKDGSIADVIGVQQNIRAGLITSLKLLRLGFAPFCPWLDFQYGLLDDEPLSKEIYYTYSIAWLEVSDAMLVISGVGLNSGVDTEIKRAIELNIPIYHSIDEMLLSESEEGEGVWVSVENFKRLKNTAYTAKKKDDYRQCPFSKDIKCDMSDPCGDCDIRTGDME